MLDGRVKRGTGCKLAVSNSNPFCDPLLDEDPPDSTDRNVILLFEDFETRESFDSLLGEKESRESGNILEFEGGLYTFFRGLHVFANGILIDAEQLGEGGGSPRFSPPPPMLFAGAFFLAHSARFTASLLRVLRIYMSTIVCSNVSREVWPHRCCYTLLSVCVRVRRDTCTQSFSSSFSPFSFPLFFLRFKRISMDTFSKGGTNAWRWLIRI